MRHESFCDRHFEDDLWQYEGSPSVSDGLQLKAIKRVERGERVLPVAGDLGIPRKLLQDWNEAGIRSICS